MAPDRDSTDDNEPGGTTYSGPKQAARTNSGPKQAAPTTRAEQAAPTYSGPKQAAPTNSPEAGGTDNSGPAGRHRHTQAPAGLRSSRQNFSSPGSSHRAAGPSYTVLEQQPGAKVTGVARGGF